MNKLNICVCALVAAAAGMLSPINATEGTARQSLPQDNRETIYLDTANTDSLVLSDDDAAYADSLEQDSLSAADNDSLP